MLCFYNTMENAFNILFYNIVLGLSIDNIFFFITINRMIVMN